MPILTPQERIGTCVAGRYRIERILAKGGMSVLFEARDTRTFRPVAVKLLKTEDTADERRVARFLQEMRLTAELRDPHVVDVLDLGQEDDGSPYLVMELLHGRSLQAELDERGSLSVEETLFATLPVMGALASVHAAGVVHRDVKPDNIFLHRHSDGRIVPKLLDFGIAKQAYTSMQTRTGAVLGTPDFMAPEQVLGEEVEHTADIWATGAVLFRALSGETPFRSPTAAQVLARLSHEPAPPLRVAGIAPAFCAAIDRALVRDPHGRYADMNEFAQVIRLCASEAGYAVPTATATAPAAFDERVRSRVFAQRGATQPSRESLAPTRRATLRPTSIALAVFGVCASAVMLSVVGHEAGARAERRPAVSQVEPGSPLIPDVKEPEPALVARASGGMTAGDEASGETGAHVAHVAIEAHGAVSSALPVRVVQTTAAKPHRPVAAAHAGHAESAGVEQKRTVRDLPIVVEW